MKELCTHKSYSAVQRTFSSRDRQIVAVITELPKGCYQGEMRFCKGSCLRRDRSHIMKSIVTQTRHIREEEYKLVWGELWNWNIFQLTRIVEIWRETITRDKKPRMMKRLCKYILCLYKDPRPTKRNWVHLRLSLQFKIFCRINHRTKMKHLFNNRKQGRNWRSCSFMYWAMQIVLIYSRKIWLTESLLHFLQ